MPDSENSIEDQVVAAIGRVLRDSGREVPDLTPDTLFADSVRLNSLDFAVVVVQLEQSLGVDPFRNGAQAVQTVGEFVRLYEDAINNNAS